MGCTARAGISCYFTFSKVCKSCCQNQITSDLLFLHQLPGPGQCSRRISQTSRVGTAGPWVTPSLVCRVGADGIGCCRVLHCPPAAGRRIIYLNFAWEKSPDAGRSIQAQPSTGRELGESSFSLPSALRGSCCSLRRTVRSQGAGQCWRVGSCPQRGGPGSRV